MAKIGQPKTSLARQREHAEDARQDAKIVRRAISARTTAQQELNSGRYTAEHIAQRQKEIAAAFTETASDALKRMRERAIEAQTAITEWAPAQRRLGASLADPEASAALAQRLARVGPDDLRRLAADAVQRSDLLLADAIVAQFDRFPKDDPNSVVLFREVQEQLDQVAAEDAQEVAALAAIAGRAYVDATIASAEAAGTPMPPADRLTLIRSVPYATEPVAV